ncbi:MAG: Uxx-star family glutaredoxin-like (seleno)protein [Candidatus Baltobacteraceae bacterium]
MLELYGTASCPYTLQLREELEWKGEPFTEYDVEQDARAFARMIAMSGGNCTVPVLVQGGRIVQTGYEGRGCYVKRA